MSYLSPLPVTLLQLIKFKNSIVAPMLLLEISKSVSSWTAANKLLRFKLVRWRHLDFTKRLRIRVEICGHEDKSNTRKLCCLACCSEFLFRCRRKHSRLPSVSHWHRDILRVCNRWHLSRRMGCIEAAVRVEFDKLVKFISRRLLWLFSINFPNWFDCRGRSPMKFMTRRRWHMGRRRVRNWGWYGFFRTKLSFFICGMRLSTKKFYFSTDTA